MDWNEIYRYSKAKPENQNAYQSLKAWREDKTLKETALELGYLTDDEFKQWVRPEDMVGPSDWERIWLEAQAF